VTFHPPTKELLPEFHVKTKFPSFTCSWRRILGKYSVLYHFHHHLALKFPKIVVKQINWNLFNLSTSLSSPSTVPSLHGGQFAESLEENAPKRKDLFVAQE